MSGHFKIISERVLPFFIMMLFLLDTPILWRIFHGDLLFQPYHCKSRSLRCIKCCHLGIGHSRSILWGIRCELGRLSHHYRTETFKILPCFFIFIKFLLILKNINRLRILNHIGWNHRWMIGLLVIALVPNTTQIIIVDVWLLQRLVCRVVYFH